MTRGCGRVEEQRQRTLEQTERRDDVDLEGDTQIVERVVRQRGEWRRPQCPGVVDHEVEPTQLEGGGREVVAVVVVGDVAHDDGDPCPVLRGSTDALRRGVQRDRVTTIHHE